MNNVNGKYSNQPNTSLALPQMTSFNTDIATAKLQSNPSLLSVATLNAMEGTVFPKDGMNTDDEYVGTDTDTVDCSELAIAVLKYCGISFDKNGFTYPTKTRDFTSGELIKIKKLLKQNLKPAAYAKVQSEIANIKTDTDVHSLFHSLAGYAAGGQNKYKSFFGKNGHPVAVFDAKNWDALVAGTPNDPAPAPAAPAKALPTPPRKAIAKPTKSKHKPASTTTAPPVATSLATPSIAKPKKYVPLTEWNFISPKSPTSIDYVTTIHGIPLKKTKFQSSDYLVADTKDNFLTLNPNLALTPDGKIPANIPVVLVGKKVD